MKSRVGAVSFCMGVVVVNRVGALKAWSKVLYRCGMVFIDLAFADIAEAGRCALLRIVRRAPSRSYATLRSAHARSSFAALTS